MLSRIEKISGLGLLHNTSAANIGLAKVALIYADNARGKSTFSSLMRSVGSGDTDELRKRKTLDGTEEVSALLKFDTSVVVELDQDGWTATRPEVVVFDSDFVDRNAYSGFEVASRQRKNLLQFALGSSAVIANTAVETSTETHNLAKTRLLAAEQTLETHHAELSLTEFRALKKPAEYEEERASLNLRIQDASKILRLFRRQHPRQFPARTLMYQTL